MFNQVGESSGEHEEEPGGQDRTTGAQPAPEGTSGGLSTTMPRSSLPGLNRIVRPGGIGNSSLGRLGFLPIPRFRFLTTKTPKPRSSMRFPRTSDWSRALMMASTARTAVVRETPASRIARLTRSVLIIPVPVYFDDVIRRNRLSPAASLVVARAARPSWANVVKGKGLVGGQVCPWPLGRFVVGKHQPARPAAREAELTVVPLPGGLALHLSY